MTQTPLLQGPLAPFATWTGYLVEVYFDVSCAALRLRPHASNDPARVHLDWHIAFPYRLRTTTGELFSIARLIAVWPNAAELRGRAKRPHYRVGGTIRRERDGALYDARGRPLPTEAAP